MDTAVLMESIRKYIPKDTGVQMRFQEKLESIGAEGRSKIASSLTMLGLKNPSLIFWLGSFFLGNFGVGRFMAGHIGLGIARLVLFIAYLAASFMLGEDSILGLLVLLLVWIWWIADLFLVGKKVREENLAKILTSFKN